MTDDTAKKTTSFYPNFFGGFFSRNTMNHFSNFSTNYAVVKCKSKCKFVLSLKVPNHLQTIAENSIKEGVLMPDGNPDVFNFWVDGKKSPLKFKIHIKSSHLKTGSSAKEPTYRFSKETIGKMVKLEYTSTKPSAHKTLASRSIIFKTDDSHLDDRTLLIELKDLEMG